MTGQLKTFRVNSAYLHAMLAPVQRWTMLRDDDDDDDDDGDGENDGENDDDEEMALPFAVGMLTLIVVRRMYLSLINGLEQ